MPPPPAHLRGQLVEHPPIESVTFDLGTVPPPVQYRLYTGLFGPAVTSASTGPIVIGVDFQVTAPGCSLVGYSQWCCNSGQDTTPVPYALWHLTGTGTNVIFPAATITGASLVQGRFNDTLLPAPVPLVAGACYVAQMGMANGLPLTLNFWGAGDVGYRGIVDGPLAAFSDQGATNPAPFSQPQGCFGTGDSDPTLGIVATANASFTSWLDVLISTG